VIVVGMVPPGFEDGAPQGEELETAFDKVISLMQETLYRKNVDLQYRPSAEHHAADRQEGVYVDSLANGSEIDPGSKINILEAMPDHNHARALVHDGHHQLLEQAENLIAGAAEEQLGKFID